LSREDADMELPRKRIRVACLSPEQLDRMYALMKDYYENVDRLVFESDLKEKDWVLVINDDNSDRIVGFSTQVLFHMEFLLKNGLWQFGTMPVMNHTPKCSDTGNDPRESSGTTFQYPASFSPLDTWSAP